MEAEVVSLFFSDSANETKENDISDDFLGLVDELNDRLESYNMPKAVQCVYNPTIYARHTFDLYAHKYCNTTKPIMYLGMNPGPWGMSQTGVPFGEVSSVRDWLGIEGPVAKPPGEISARPVLGFECTRTEISGKRFWGLFKDLCGSPERFFKSSFVYNYLPQQWMRSNGCNVTPGDLKRSEVDELFSICDPIFCKVLELYKVEKIIAVGKFCETRALKVVRKYFPSNAIQILYMPHPSPRTVNNNDWDKKALKFLSDNNFLQYYLKKD